MQFVIPIAYVSKQLGHVSIAATLKHYAKQLGEDYQNPIKLSLSELPPANLLAHANDQKLTMSVGESVEL